VDRPDGRRKLHPDVIPVVGGPAILVSVGLALLVALQVPGPLREGAGDHADLLVGLLVAGVFLCALGVADDFGRLRGRHKLLGQVVAVAVVIAAGVQVRAVHLLGADFDLGVMAIPFTAFLLLGAINSLNLIDGMDGLLGSVAFILCLALGAMAWFGGRDVTACVAFALAGSLLAFLCFNFPPATLFMGDSGSMVIGLTVGVLAIHGSLKTPTTVALATPAALLAIPLFDTLAAVVRRKLTGRSIYCTDRAHLHHLLLRRLEHPRRVLLVVSCCCLVTAAGAFAGVLLRNELIGLGTAVAVVALLTGTRLFGHAELLLVKTRLARLVVSFFPARGAGQFRRMDVHLQGTHNWKALLDEVAARAFGLNLQTVRLDISAPALHEEYHARWDRFEESDALLWRAEIPLVVGERTVGSLFVSGHPGPEPLWAKVAALTEMIEAFGKADGAGAVPAGVQAIHGKKPADRPALTAVVCPVDGKAELSV
jgi:UDP-GlcNAc:undecaprenyl-phosphate GlcNAc-1-phosphate transferase